MPAQGMEDFASQLTDLSVRPSRQRLNDRSRFLSAAIRKQHSRQISTGSQMTRVLLQHLAEQVDSPNRVAVLLLEHRHLDQQIRSVA